MKNIIIAILFIIMASSVFGDNTDEDISCIDSDGGKEIYVKGTLSFSNSNGYLTDSCQQKTSEYSYSSAPSCSGSLCYIEEAYCPSPVHLQFTSEYIQCIDGCKDGACIKKLTCTDSDGGADHLTAGKAYNGEKLGYDQCALMTVNNGVMMENPVSSCDGPECSLSEAICLESGETSSQRFSCPDGCVQGACIKKMSCKDSDGGADYYSAGKTYSESGIVSDGCNIVKNNNGNTITSGVDSCEGPECWLSEGLCNDIGGEYTEYYMCLYGCKAGACLKKMSCKDTDGGADYYSAGKAYSESGSVSDECNTVIYYNGLVKTSGVDSCNGPECMLSEGLCNEIGGEYADFYSCPYGCKAGACIKGNNCIDSDGGRDYYTFGKAYNELTTFEDECLTISENNGKVAINHEESCDGSECMLSEAQCNLDGAISTDIYPCPNGCVRGVCVLQLKENCTTLEIHYGPQGETYYRFVDADGDGCDAGTDSDCGGVEGTGNANISCFDGIDSDCDGMIDSADDDGSCKLAFNGTITQYTLADFPHLFIKDGRFDGKFVAGASASSSDVIALINVGEGVMSVPQTIMPTDSRILDTELKTLETNIISVGNPCNNKVTAKIMGSYECDFMLDSGAIIVLKQHPPYWHLALYGVTDEDTLMASKVLQNYFQYQLNGDTFYVAHPDADEMCTDSDGGLNYEVQGKVIKSNDNGESISYDNCGNDGLEEFYCNELIVSSKIVKCPYGCIEGRCLSEVPTCGDTVCVKGETCQIDCGDIENVMLAYDIEGHKYLYSTLSTRVDPDTGKISFFTSIYLYQDAEIPVYIVQAETNELATILLKDEVFKPQKDYRVTVINGNEVFIVDNMAIWIHDNYVIGVKLYDFYDIPLEEEKSGMAITGNVVSNTESSYGKLEKLQKQVSKPLNSQTKTSFDLVEAYLLRYPADKFNAVVCGDGICDYSEQGKCHADCDSTCKPIRQDDKAMEYCYRTGGTWVNSFGEDGCPLPPYCIYSPSNDTNFDDIGEIEMLVVIMKLEKLSTKVQELKRTAESLAQYYQKEGNIEKATAWLEASSGFSQITKDIASVQQEITESENPKATLKAFLQITKSRLSEIIQALIKSIRGGA